MTRKRHQDQAFDAALARGREALAGAGPWESTELIRAERDTYYAKPPCELVRSTRQRLGLSQRRLAIRAGTTPTTISRIEQGLVSPTFKMLSDLMLAMGEELLISSRRLPLPANWDPMHMASMLERTPEERLALALSWNRTAARLASAGSAARDRD